MLLLLLCFTIRARGNGRMYSLTHGHLNSKAAQPLPSLLLAQCKLFMARNSQTRGLGEKDKNDLKKKKRGWGLYQLQLKEEKHGRTLSVLFVSFVTIFQGDADEENVDARS